MSPVITDTPKTSRSISEWLEYEVYTRLTADSVFTHPVHQFRKNGSKWRGGCPWHDSASGTSFAVEPDTLLWYDAGCLVGGGPLEYLHRIDGGDGHLRGSEFIAYARRAGELAGIPFPERKLTPEEQERARSGEERRNILEVVNRLAVARLWSEEGDAARAYLSEQRRVSLDAIRALGLGLYPDRATLAAALHSSGFSKQDIHSTGVLSTGDGRLFDDITIPWADEHGRALTISGRAIGTPPGIRPKATGLPGERSKRSPLYYDRARRDRHSNLVLVEGLLDAVTAQAHGETNVISCVGAQLSTGQVETLKRNRVQSVTMCLDPDGAGVRGTTSCIRSLLAADITPYVAPELPDGMDPDEFIVAYGIDEWRAHIDQHVHGFRYVAQQIIGSRGDDAWSDPNKSAVLTQARAFASEYSKHHVELATFFWPSIEDALDVPHGSFSIPGDSEDSGLVESPDESAWEKRTPLPEVVPSVPSLPSRLIPDPLREWLEDIASRASIPLEYAAVPALVGVGTVIGRKVGIRPEKRDDWIVVPNLWGMIVGRPGTMKSHAINEPLKPLKRLQIEAQEEYEQRKIGSDVRIARLDAEIAGLKQQITAATKSKTPNPQQPGTKDDITVIEYEIATRMREIAETRVTRRRLYTNDATVEKLSELAQENPNGLLVLRDELSGWQRSLEKSGREGDREFYLEAWNGTGGFDTDRIGRGSISVPALVLSIVGSIQPGKLQSLIRGAISEGAGDDGLLQRFQLAVWPDRLGEWKPIAHYPNGEAKNRAYAVFQALDRLSPDDLSLPPVAAPDIPCLSFADDAQRLFDQWRAELEGRLRSDELTKYPAFESHLAKYRSLMPSLALIFHLLSVSSVPSTSKSAQVSLEASRLAAAWCEFLETHARKMYAAELNAAVDVAHLLVEKIESGALRDGQTVRDLYRNQWSGLTTPERVDEALKVLGEHNWVRVDPIATDGRTSVIVRLHPELRGYADD